MDFENFQMLAQFISCFQIWRQFNASKDMLLFHFFVLFSWILSSVVSDFKLISQAIVHRACLIKVQGFKLQVNYMEM